MSVITVSNEQESEKNICYAVFNVTPCAYFIMVLNFVHDNIWKIGAFLFVSYLLDIFLR
jgi:hypothetical protein